VNSPTLPDDDSQRTPRASTSQIAYCLVVLKLDRPHVALNSTSERDVQPLSNPTIGDPMNTVSVPKTR